MTPTRPDHTRLLLAFLVGGILASAAIGPTYAQSGVRSVGAVATGGGTSALGTGPASLFSNPAALTVGETDYTFAVQLLRLSGYSGGDLLKFNHYNDTFTSGETLGRKQIDATLDDWFGGSMQSVSLYTEIVPVAVTYRPSDAPWAAGMGVRIRSIGKSSIDEGVLDLLLKGTEPSRTVPVNGRYRAYNTIEIAGTFSYQMDALPLSIGATPKFILGTGYADGDLSSQVTVSDSTLLHEFDYTVRAAGEVSTGLYDKFDAFSDEPVPEVLGTSSTISGSGVGIDVGGTYALRSDLYVSLSVTDLGLVHWSQDAQTVTPQTNAFEFEGVQLSLRRLTNGFDGDVGDYVRHQVDSLARDAYRDVERDRSSFTTGLPTTLHASGTWEQGLAILNGGVSVGLNGKAGAVPDPAAVHVGGEVVLGPVPIRAGVRAWGNQAVTLSGGVGLDLGFYQFDLGASVTPSTSTLGSGARYAVSLSLATIRF